MIRNTFIWHKICDQIMRLEKRAGIRWRKGKGISILERRINRLKRWRAIW